LRAAQACGVAKRRRRVVAAFTINNFERRAPNLLEWLRRTKPDILYLQELKGSTRISRH